MAFDAALTAWTTLALAVLALIAAIVAGGAWVVQARQLNALRQVNAKQLPVLEGQRVELEASRQQRERDEHERRERFVTQVFCWHELGYSALAQAQVAARAMPGRMSNTYLRNAGPVPVYDVAFSWWINGQQDLWSCRSTPLMPHDMSLRDGESEAHWYQPIPADGDPETIEIAVFIRDAAGYRWRLRPGGRYEEFSDDMLAPDDIWPTT